MAAFFFGGGGRGSFFFNREGPWAPFYEILEATLYVTLVKQNRACQFHCACNQLFHNPESVCPAVHGSDSLSYSLQYLCATMWLSYKTRMSVLHVSCLFVPPFIMCLTVLQPRTYLHHHTWMCLSNKTECVSSTVHAFHSPGHIPLCMYPTFPQPRSCLFHCTCVSPVCSVAQSMFIPLYMHFFCLFCNLEHVCSAVHASFLFVPQPRACLFHCTCVCPVCSRAQSMLVPLYVCLCCLFHSPEHVFFCCTCVFSICSTA